MIDFFNAVGAAKTQETATEIALSSELKPELQNQTLRPSDFSFDDNNRTDNHHEVSRAGRG